MGKLGKLNIVIGAINNTQKAFKNIQHGLKKISDRTAFIRKQFKRFALAVSGVTLVFAALILRQTAFIDRLGDTADKLGVASDFLQKFRFAAQQTGIRIETADMALQRFTRRIAEADKGVGEARGALEQLGISTRTTNGVLKSAEQVLFEVADGIAKTTSESEKVRLAFKFFDSEGVSLVNTLKGGSDVLQQFFQDAENLGSVLTRNSVKGVQKFKDELGRLGALLTGLANQVTAKLAPALEFLTKKFTNFAIELFKTKGGVEAFAASVATSILSGVSVALVSIEKFANETMRILFEANQSLVKMGFISESIDVQNARKRITEIENEISNLSQTFETMRTSAGAFSHVLVSKEMTDAEKTRVQELKEELISLQEFIGKPMQITGLSTLSNEINDLILKFPELMKEFDEMINKNNQLGDSTVNLGEMFRGVLSKMQNNLSNLDAAQGRIATALETNLTNAFMNIEKGISSLGDSIKAMAKAIIQELIRIFVVQKIVGAITSAASPAPVPMMARGGTATGGKAVIVGEKGAELFVPNRTGTIVPNNQLAASNEMAAPVNVSFNISAMDAEGLDKLLVKKKNLLVSVVSQAMNQRGKVGLV